MKPLKLISINIALYVFFFYFYTFSEAFGINKYSVSYLPHRHWRPEISLLGPNQQKELINKISYEQFFIIQFLSKFKNSVIFSEAIKRDVSYQELVSYEQQATLKDSLLGRLKVIKEQAYYLFKEGMIPKAYSSLTWRQKEFLAKVGGDVLLFVLNHTNELKSTYHPSYQAVPLLETMHKKHKIEIEKKQLDHVKIVREKMVVSSIMNYLGPSILTKSKKIVLIFGRGHNFERYFLSNNRINFSTIFPNKHKL